LKDNINQRIKDVRKVLGLTQQDFANDLKISQSHAGAIELGSRKIPERIIKMISFTYKVNENWLKTGKGEMFHKSTDEKINRLVNIFNELPPDFQDFALLHLDRLLDLRKKQTP